MTEPTTNRRVRNVKPGDVMRFSGPATIRFEEANGRIRVVIETPDNTRMIHVRPGSGLTNRGANTKNTD